ncbi:MAG: polysaccharide biosynthesis tyrosine autokinase [Candidatus Neomarinimicrobiota bacterium]
MPHYELNLRDYWRIIKKKKIIVTVTLVMLSGFSLIFAIMNRPTPLYRATASLKIERNTNLSGLYMYSLSWGSGDDLATRAEEIKSYPMIEKAAQVMSLIDSALTSEEIRSNKEYFDIVSKLKARVKTEQEGYTNIINIIVTDFDPVFTANLANALAKVYETESFKEKNLQADRALDAVRSQRALAERALRNSELKVQNYREQNKFATLDGASSRLAGELNVAETNLDKIRDDITQIDNILREIEHNHEYIYLANLSLLLSQPNRFLEDLQTRLTQIRSQIATYSQHYTPQHPVIIDLQNQLKSSEKRFVNELKSFRQNLARAETIANAKYQKIDAEYKSIPMLGLALSNLERDLGINTQIYQELEIRYQEALIKYSEQIKEVFLIRPAFVPTNPINPTMIGPTTAIGTIIGMILGIVLAFVAETLDTTFSTIDDIEKTLDTTVMGIVPFVDIQSIKTQIAEKSESPIPDEILEMQARLASHYNPKSTMAESFRGLRTNVHFALLDKGYKTMMITSSVASEGKTTVSVNLALSMAQIGINTLLVEADLRKPRVSKLFGIDREPGLTDIILRKDPIDTTIRTMSDLLMGTMASDTFRSDIIAGIEYLNILTCGKIERNPSEIIASKLMDNLMADLKERYDLVIFDSAPVIQATDATVLGAKVDTVLLVYYQGKISRGTLRRSKSQLEMLKSDILGVVVNGMKADISADYSDYKYSYEYHYQEETLEPKNKVVAALESFFLKPAEGLPTGFFSQLNKIKAIITLGLLGLIIGGSMWGITKIRATHIKSSVEGKQTETIITPSPDAIPGTEASNALPIITDSLATDTTLPTVAVVPTKLKQIQDKYGIEANPQQQVVQTLPAIRQTVPEKAEPPYIAPPSTAAPVTQSNPYPSTQYSPAVTPPSRPVTLPVNLKDSEQIKQLKTSYPYTLIIRHSANESDLVGQLEKLRRSGLAAFITIDFSDPGQKKYNLCFGSFATQSEASKKSKELQFLGFSGTFQPVRIPITILLEKFSNLQTAQKALERYQTIRDYLYIQPSSQKPGTNKEFYLLFGGFTDTETAELMMISESVLNSKTIVKR